MICVVLVFILGYFGLLKSDILSSFLIQIVVMLAIPLLLYNLLIGKKFKATLNETGVKKVSGKIILIAIGLGFVLYFLNSFVADAFSSLLALLGYENLSSAVSVKLTYGLLFKEFVLSAILPGICEEFLHRGIMLMANKNYSSPRFALICSSILFGLMHLNIGQFFYAAILGLLMGIVAMVADSIIPTMIIHFMNNFLSSYFYYGKFLNWPFARFLDALYVTLMNNIFMFVFISLLGVSLLLLLYARLVKALHNERRKQEIKKVIAALEKEDIPLEEVQLRINQANQILNEKNMFNKTAKKSSFFEKVFLISAFFLGGLITISTFVWGII